MEEFHRVEDLVLRAQGYLKKIEALEVQAEELRSVIEKVQNMLREHGFYGGAMWTTLEKALSSTQKGHNQGTSPERPTE
jgi:hypothetical protein